MIDHLLELITAIRTLDSEKLKYKLRMNMFAISDREYDSSFQSLKYSYDAASHLLDKKEQELLSYIADNSEALIKALWAMKEADD